MKKAQFLVALLFLIVSLVNAQQETFESLLAKGKAEFKKEFDSQDFNKAVLYLEKATTLKPNHQEAKYFLGYAYGRLNAKDGTSISAMNLELTKKSSEQFEAINKSDKPYEGEILILDTYTKISSEWGSLAMAYLNEGKKEKAIWAFKEGKNRGGFGDFFLELSKNLLNSCNKDAILFVSGDIFTMNIWYLQYVENYRTDLAVVNIDLLDTDWYPKFLIVNNIVKFDKTTKEVEAITYKEWETKQIEIADFKWVLKPSYAEQYLLRKDFLMLSILRQNNFKQNVFFSMLCPFNNLLSLSNNLVSYGLVDIVDIYDQVVEPLDLNSLAEELTPLVNKKSQDETRYLKFLREY